MSRSQLVIRGTTVQCPECYQWHGLQYIRILEPNDVKFKYLILCTTNHRTPKKVLVPFTPEKGMQLPEYIEPSDHVFIKDGSFKIVKKADHMQPKLFGS